MTHRRTARATIVQPKSESKFWPRVEGAIILLFCLLLCCMTWMLFTSPANADALPAVEQISETSSQMAEQRLEQLGRQAFAATQRGDFALAERLWSEMLTLEPNNPALWSNRGNARVSQHKLAEAIADYDRAIELLPDAPDPYLNRGTALEGLGRWQEAIADYNRVLALDPRDAAAYNNRGNAEAGLGQWDIALQDYQKATELAPDYAFAFANYTLALYQTGDTQKAIRLMRNLVRKYPQFPDMRAALTAALWAEGKIGEAESEWVAVVGLDRRYKDIAWVQEQRRWPPAMVNVLANFLTLRR